MASGGSEEPFAAHINLMRLKFRRRTAGTSDRAVYCWRDVVGRQLFCFCNVSGLFGHDNIAESQLMALVRT